ncbi:TIGR02444 family protein [Nitrospirillum sp. BR 11164]|uniref:TIGR02444 family protein n=1 Tax=Nitrospirillum sp. BR 11164 TaxID=3104324 RepID=UPI002AFEFA7F|nr:TIGR02444 family protein [Nitrospirillum sp. BR 11164]MEA1650350.1 TIGR02444 family protein [Nitrospirillum sp. BR 11164]
MPEPLAPFWPYALDAYARPGVAEACLAAQDGHGADVPLLLWGAWAAARGHTLTEGDLDAAATAAARWRAPVIEPLRQARRALKALAADAPANEALRQAVKAAELEAERLYMASLEQLADGWPAPTPPRPQTLRDNLARLLPPEAAPVTERLHKALS